MNKGYIASLAFFALIWVAAIAVPGGRGEAMMALCAIACMSTGMLTYLHGPFDRRH